MHILEKMVASTRRFYPGGFPECNEETDVKDIISRNVALKTSDWEEANAASKARRFPMVVMKGDGGEFWVVRPDDGERLFQAGYEYANGNKKEHAMQGMKRLSRLIEDKELPAPTTIKLRGHDTYITPIDFTHVYVHERPERKGMALHVGQIDDPLGTDIYRWLGGRGTLKSVYEGAGAGRLSRLVEDDPVKAHQIKVAIDSLKMNPAMLGVMGGMDKKQAREILRAAGWTDAQIWKAELNKPGVFTR